MSLLPFSSTVAVASPPIHSRCRKAEPPPCSVASTRPRCRNTPFDVNRLPAPRLPTTRSPTVPRPVNVCAVPPRSSVAPLRMCTVMPVGRRLLPPASATVPPSMAKLPVKVLAPRSVWVPLPALTKWPALPGLLSASSPAKSPEPSATPRVKAL